MFDFLSRGDLEVILEKFQFSPGDTVSGKITLKLKKPTQANKLTVSVVGQKITKKREINFAGNMPREQTTIDKIFSFDLQLDGSKEYTEGEYPFSIKLPVDIVQQQTMANSEGALGTVAKVFNAVNNLSGGTTVRTEWFVEAQLDVPKAIDMRKKVMINVG